MTTQDKINTAEYWCLDGDFLFIGDDITVEIEFNDNEDLRVTFAVNNETNEEIELTYEMLTEAMRNRCEESHTDRFPEKEYGENEYGRIYTI